METLSNADKTNAQILKEISERMKNDEIVFMTNDGAMIIKLEDFVKQEAEGMLYDLNRDFASLATIGEKSKNLRFVNDIACANVIKYLKKMVDSKDTEIVKLKDEIEGLKKDKANKKTQFASVSSFMERENIKEGFNTSLEINM